VSINAGFSLADIVDVGPTVLLTADGRDPQPATTYQAMAEELMDHIWATRAVVSNHYLSPAEAAAIAETHVGQNKPLVIADYADNPGAGTYGDATNLLKAMLDAKLDNAVFGALRDAEAAAELVAAGVGATVALAIGGKVDPRFGGPPLEVKGEVQHISAGRYVCDGPMWAGLAKSFGPSAVLRVDGVDILIVSNLLQITDLQQFLSNGIDPRQKKTVALKSMQHFRAAYEPIASKVIVCDSGALASPERSRLPFQKVRRPLYPLDLDTQA
jgi:microcystin degradation protein MlrC